MTIEKIKNVIIKIVYKIIKVLILFKKNNLKSVKKFRRNSGEAEFNGAKVKTMNQIGVS